MKMKTGIIGAALLAAWVGGAEVSAQDAKPLTVITREGTTREGTTRDAKLTFSSVDFSTPAGATTYGYKRWSTVDAVVCNAFIGGKNDKHATLFLNIAQKGSPATNCDPYTTPTVYTTVNRNMANMAQFMASLPTSKIRIKDAFFKRDRDRERYITYANIEKDANAIEINQGGSYVALKMVKADIERTDTAYAAQMEEEKKKLIEEQKTIERERAQESVTSTRTRTSTSTSTGNGREGGFNFFNWFKSLFE
jgi:hypothetical protein